MEADDAAPSPVMSKRRCGYVCRSALKNRRDRQCICLWRAGGSLVARCANTVAQGGCSAGECFNVAAWDSWVSDCQLPCFPRPQIHAKLPTLQFGDWSLNAI